MSSEPTSKVTSAGFQRAFGHYRELALQQPVAITSHGRDSLVLLSADEYKRLKSLDQRSLYAWEMSEDAVTALAAAEPPSEAAKFDHEIKPRHRQRK
jgi:PHD/YefM family antitoxin component YafN of YafNO toxin-antitoxin module